MHETVTLLPAAEIRFQLDFWLWDADVPLALFFDESSLEEILVPYLQNHQQKNRGIVFAPEPEKEMSFPVAEAIAALLDDEQVFDQLLDRPIQEWPLIWREHLGQGKGNDDLHHVLMVESVELMADRSVEERLDFAALLFALAAEPRLSVAVIINREGNRVVEPWCVGETTTRHDAMTPSLETTPSLEIKEVFPPIPEEAPPIPEEEKTPVQEKTQRKLLPAFLVGAVYTMIGSAVIAIIFSDLKKAEPLKISFTAPITETKSPGVAWPQPEDPTVPSPEIQFPPEPQKVPQPRTTALFRPIEVALFSRNLEIAIPKIRVGIELPTLDLADHHAGADLKLSDIPIKAGLGEIPASPLDTARTSRITSPSQVVLKDLLERVSFEPPVVQLQLLALPVSIAPEMKSDLDAGLSLFTERSIGELELSLKPKASSHPPELAAVLKRFKSLTDQSPEGLRQVYAALSTTGPDDASSQASGNWVDQIVTSPETFEREVALAFRQIGDEEFAFVWFYKWARRSGQAEALFEVGAAKFLGLGTPRNVSLAIPYLLRAWQFGDENAGYLYGVAQLFGWGIPRNEAGAFVTFQEACHLGSTLPYREMARMCELGIGVPPDLNEALKFYCQGAGNADPYCLKRLTEIDGNETDSAFQAVPLNSSHREADPIHEAVTQLQSGDFYTRNISG